LFTPRPGLRKGKNWTRPARPGPGPPPPRSFTLRPFSPPGLIPLLRDKCDGRISGRGAAAQGYFSPRWSLSPSPSPWPWGTGTGTGTGTGAKLASAGPKCGRTNFLKQKKRLASFSLSRPQCNGHFRSAVIARSYAAQADDDDWRDGRQSLRRRQQQQQQQQNLSTYESSHALDSDLSEESPDEEEDEEEEEEQEEDSEARSMLVRQNCCAVIREEEDCTCCEKIFPCWCGNNNGELVDQHSDGEEEEDEVRTRRCGWTCCRCCCRWPSSPSASYPLDLDLESAPSSASSGLSCLRRLRASAAARSRRVKAHFCDLVEFRQHGRTGGR